MLSRIVVHGHRGARARRPENTLAGFAYAIDAGADFIEMDVNITADDVPVVIHDPALKDGGVVRALRFAEVRPREASVPTLAEVLDLAGRGGVQFNIEAKSYPDRPDYGPPPERIAELVVEAVRGRALEARVIVQSFDFRVLHAMRDLASEIRLAALDETDGGDFVAIAGRAGTRIIAPHHGMVTGSKVRAAHAAGIQVIPWTVNGPHNWERMAGCGVDGMITDDPAGLIDWLEHHGRR